MRYFRGLLFLLYILLSLTVSAQKYAAGGSVMYNLQTESVGFGARGILNPNRNWSYSLQISYHPSFNPVHEYNLGLGAEYKFMRQRKVFFYLLGHGGYNGWINYKESPMKDPKYSNWNVEGGVGASMWTCLRPFIEWRYNANFREAHFQLGLIYVFGCRCNTNPGSNSGFFGFGGPRKKGCSGYGNY